MRIRKKLWYLLVISIASVALLLYLVISYPPTYAFNLSGFSIIIFPLVFLSLIIFLWSLTSFIFANKTQGVLIATLTVIYLILRMNKLNQLFFLIMLLIIFAVFEFLLFRKK